MELRSAGHVHGESLRPLQRGCQDRQQQDDDGHHRQEFDQGEPEAPPSQMCVGSRADECSCSAGRLKTGHHHGDAPAHGRARPGRPDLLYRDLTASTVVCPTRRGQRKIGTGAFFASSGIDDRRGRISLGAETQEEPSLGEKCACPIFRGPGQGSRNRKFSPVINSRPGASSGQPRSTREKWDRHDFPLDLLVDYVAAITESRRFRLTNLVQRGKSRQSRFFTPAGWYLIVAGTAGTRRGRRRRA